jgi:hypothetical protein
MILASIGAARQSYSPFNLCLKMQKLLFSLLLLAVPAIVYAQDTPPCATFNEGSMDNWELINCFKNPAGPFINPFDLSQSASIRDNHATSVFENNTDYKKLGTRFLGKCLVFDYNVRNDGVTGKRRLIHPTIYVTDKYGRSVYFTAQASVGEGTGWAHVRAPIVHFNYARMIIPSNNDGYWTSPYLPGVFDEIIDSCVKISFTIDLLGSSATTEEVNVDNVCVVDCNDSSSKSCYADFKFVYSQTTMRSHARNRMGKIELFEFHKSSVYQVDWGDGFISESLEPHTYEPGVYELSITETTLNGGRCKASVPVCVTDKGFKDILGTTADTSCNANFMIELSTASNLAYAPKHTADISLIAESPALFVYNWGDKSPVSASPLGHLYRAGEFIICATGTKLDGTECKECMDLCISAKPDTIPTFIPEERMSTSGFRIAPNPVSGQARLLFEHDVQEAAVVSVYDMMGKLVFSDPVPQQQGHEFSLDCSSFNPGLYLVRVATDSEAYFEKISVVR